MERTEIVIVGGGVIGLAICRRLHEIGRKCLLIEKNAHFGMETSSRNSEVIHSGIYYPQHSYKQKLCIDGRKELLSYAKSRNISHNMCGKLIIAQNTEVELKKLKDLYKNGVANNLMDLKMITSQNEARKYEKNVVCHNAIYSPYTGIIDSHQMMEHFEGEILSENAKNETSMIVTNCEFLGAKLYSHSLDYQYLVKTSRGDLCCKWLVNAAGLYAHTVASRIENMPKDKIPFIYFAKGCYFKLPPHIKPFNMLVYPLPTDGGLGIHATLDLNGSVRFGPDVEWLTNPFNQYEFKYDIEFKPNYNVDEEKQHRFREEIMAYYPQITDCSLIPDYAGVRPKVAGPGATASDFVLQMYTDHGVKNLINLFGIESPGLTSSMSIANVVTSAIERNV